MSRVSVLERLYSKKKSALEFNYDNLWAPPIRALLSQEDINKVASHINSVYRPDVDLVPYITFKELFGESTLKKLKIDYVDPNSIILNQSLLR